MFKYLVLSLLNMLWYNKSVKVWIRNFSYLDFIFQNVLSIFGFLAIILLIFKIESRLRYNCNRFLCFLRHKIIFAKQISKQKFAIYDISIKYDSFLMISWEWTYTSFVTNVLSRWCISYRVHAIEYIVILIYVYCFFSVTSDYWKYYVFVNKLCDISTFTIQVSPNIVNSIIFQTMYKRWKCPLKKSDDHFRQ